MKKTRSAYKAGPRDCCQTPAYALEPLLPYLPKESVVWEPACGEGRLAQALSDSKIPSIVFKTDIGYGYEFDFLNDPCDVRHIDSIVTNPPWSHPAKGRFIARCYELGKPFALLVPVDTLGNKSFQEPAKKFGFEVMLLSERVDFHMPYKGYTRDGADLPVLWLCHGILPQQVVWGHIEKPKGEKQCKTKKKDPT